MNEMYLRPVTINGEECLLFGNADADPYDPCLSGQLFRFNDVDSTTVHSMLSMLNLLVAEETPFEILLARDEDEAMIILKVEDSPRCYPFTFSDKFAAENAFDALERYRQILFGGMTEEDAQLLLERQAKIKETSEE